jgi:hypothetical protein
MAKLLPQLDQIEWHDTGVHSLEVSFSQRQFRIVLDCYDEIIDDYMRREAIFQEVDTVAWDGATGNDVEVSSLDIRQVGELYQAQLLLLTHHGPSATISFKFRDVTVGPESA